MKILITGIAGFVGSTITRSLLNKYPGIDVHGIDNLSFGYMDRISDYQKQIKFERNDINNLNEIYKGEAFDFVIHCAAIAPLPECQINGRNAVCENIGGTASVVDFCIKNGVQNLIFFSSGAIYEGTRNFPTPENESIKTKLIYPTTKYLAEKYLESISESYNLKIVALRLFNLYGPHQDYFRKQPPLMGYLIKSLLNNEVAQLYSSGEQRRDYIFIDDLVILIEKLMSYMSNLEMESYFEALNVGSGITYSVNEIIRKIEYISGKKMLITRAVAENYWDKYPTLYSQQIKLKDSVVKSEVEKYTEANILKAKTLLDWEPKISMDVGIQHCFDYAKHFLQ